GIHANLGNLYLMTDRPAEAEGPHRKAQALYEQLARDFPTVPEYQNGAANAHLSLGAVYHLTKRRPEAEAEYRQALARFEQMQRAYPALPLAAVRLGGVCANLGELLRENGESEGALGWYARSVETLEGVLRRNPQHAEARHFLYTARCGQA